jgi:hypothetical protein
MLHGVHACNVQIVAFVWLFKSEVVCENVAVNTVEIYACFEDVVINVE